MKRLVFLGPGRAAWEDAPTPRLEGPLEALVRPLVIGRCDLDIAYVRGLAPMAPGEPLGHEAIGEVVEIGEAVRSVRPGDKVILPAQISCGLCRMCRRGFTGRCESVPFAASYGMGREGGFGGAAADLVRAPFADAMLFPLPDAADPVAWIGVADVALDAYRAVGPALAERPGARVLVIGGLPAAIGIYAAGLAMACGAGAVDYYDADAERLAAAAAYGARPLRRGGAEPDGLYEIVVDSAAEPYALIEAFRFAEPEALVTSVTIHFGETTPAPFMEAYHKGLSFRTGRPNCRSQMEPVAALCCSGRFDPARLPTKLFAFEDAPEAWLDPALRAVAVRAA